MITWIVIIALVVVIVLWVISVQNRLVKVDELCNNSLKQIQVQQMSRYDALKTIGPGRRRELREDHRDAPHHFYRCPDRKGDQ